MSRCLRQRGDFDFAYSAKWLSGTVDQEDSSSALDAFRAPGRSQFAFPYHPRLVRAGTKLSYCNGEIGAGSRNITPYIVWGYERPRCIAQTLQQTDGIRPRRRKRWENRESRIRLAQAVRECNGHIANVADCQAPRAFRVPNAVRCGFTAHVLHQEHTRASTESP